MSGCHNVNITVTNPAGNSIASLRAIDVASTTGGAFKQMVAEAVGFPAAGMRLLLSNGVTVANNETILETLSPEMLSDTDISVACVLVMPQPFQKKTEDNQKLRRGFGSKGGRVIERRVAQAERKGRPLVSCVRTPRASLRDDIRDLIESSFAPGVAPLIDGALEAAYLAETTDETAAKRRRHVFEDIERGTYADLSTCRLWTREFNELSKGSHMEQYLDRSYNGVVSAVLWRLLFNWEGSAAITSGEGSAATPSQESVLAGPVLEVLFLATSPCFREEGDALKLQEELEKEARGLGCAAMCVAAVPNQGTSFWSRSGFSVAVPLIGKERQDSPDGAPTETEGLHLGEPTTALGEYLLANMLLFSDTPLMAKILGPEMPLRCGSDEARGSPA